MPVGASGDTIRLIPSSVQSPLLCSKGTQTLGSVETAPSLGFPLQPHPGVDLHAPVQQLRTSLHQKAQPLGWRSPFVHGSLRQVSAWQFELLI